MEAKNRHTWDGDVGTRRGSNDSLIRQAHVRQHANPIHFYPAPSRDWTRIALGVAAFVAIGLLIGAAL
jgi:hypothetical protein